MSKEINYKEYVKQSLINTKSYFVYKSKKNNRLFIENNAFSLRIRNEIFLVLMPALLYVANYFLHKNEWYSNINNLEIINLFIMAIFPFVLFFLHVLNYAKIKFDEISDIAEAKKTRLRIIEYILIFIYILAISYVTYYIAIL